MKLTVLGATGGIGTEVVRQALRAGHQVTAVVRDPARLPVEDGALEKVVADVFDAEELAMHVKGADAVVSALGPREGGPATVVRDGAAAVRWAMRETGVRRIVLVSAAGQKIAPGDDPLMRFVGKPIVQRVFRDGFADLAAMEEIIRQSGLDWTLVRPPRLSDKPGKGRYRRGIDRNVPLGFSIARADVATEILRAIPDPLTYGHEVWIAY